MTLLPMGDKEEEILFCIVRSCVVILVLFNNGSLCVEKGEYLTGDNDSRNYN